MPTIINEKRLGSGAPPSLEAGAIVRTQAKGNLNNARENVMRSSRSIESQVSQQRAQAVREGQKAEHVDIKA